MDTTRPTKRAKHDFSSTFDVIVGQLPGDVKRFTIHTDIFTKRSRFLAAARKPEWISGDPSKAVDLTDEDPDVFQAYLNVVYVGPETLEEIPGAFEREVGETTGGFSSLIIYNLCKSSNKENLIANFGEFGKVKEVSISDWHLYSKYGFPYYAVITFDTAAAGMAALRASIHPVLDGHRLTVKPCRIDSKEYYTREYELADSHYERLVNLYLLADKLRDLSTANMVMDQIQQFCNATDVHPGKVPISAAYQSTGEGSPLRKILRDMWFYYACPDDPKRYQGSGFPPDFFQDIFVEYMRIKGETVNVKEFYEASAMDHLLDEPECSVPDTCRYHQHDGEHPFCVKSPKEEEHCKTCKTKGNN